MGQRTPTSAWQRAPTATGKATQRKTTERISFRQIAPSTIGHRAIAFGRSIFAGVTLGCPPFGWLVTLLIASHANAQHKATTKEQQALNSKTKNHGRKFKLRIGRVGIDGYLVTK